MKRSNYQIMLDIRDSHGACQLDMKQSDTHRRLYITLTDGGKPYRVSEGCYAVFTAQKPDGTVIYNLCGIEDGTVVYDITPQTTAAPGLLRCEIRLLHSEQTLQPDENGVLILPDSGVRLLTSATFGIRVHPTVYNENVTLASQTEVSALSKMLLEASRSVEVAQEAAKNARAIVVTVDQGLSTSKTNGEIYACAKEGREVFLQLDNFILPLVSAEPEQAWFAQIVQKQMILHMVESDSWGYNVTLPLEKLAILDDSSTTTGAWSAKKILEMIAKGGTGDIGMNGRAIETVGRLGIGQNTVVLESEQGFLWLNRDYVPVVVRGVEQGTEDGDAVNLKQLLDLIAKGGTGDIDMGDDRWLYCGGIRAPHFEVASSFEDGFSVTLAHVDGDFGKPIAQFAGACNGDDPVLLRGIAPGTEVSDAVNKAQLDVKAQIDDAAVGGDAWSAKNTVDKLCPAFRESGILVQCEPVEGYPLDVQVGSDGESQDIVLTVCGKNLYNGTAYPLDKEGYIYRKTGKISNSTSYRRTTYIPVEHLVGKTITLNHAPVAATNPGMAFYSEKGSTEDAEDFVYISGSSGFNVVVPEGAKYMRFSVAVETVEKGVQIELGSRATEYGAYVQTQYELRDEHVEEYLAVDGIVGSGGQMTMYAVSYMGYRPVIVSGRSNPGAVIQRLTADVAELREAISALGANV